MERVWEKVERRGLHDCWLWTGQTNSKGYGVISIYVGRENGRDKKKVYRVHRLIAGTPDDQITRHTCDTPACCNPAHLLIGSPLENMVDMVQRGRQNLTHTRLTPDQVRAIRADRRLYRDIAAEHRISEAYVSDIKSRRKRSNVA
jgi:hypothetical protein